MPASPRPLSASAIAQAMEKQYTVLPGPGRPVTRHEMVRLWTLFAKQYLSASELLHGRQAPLLLPWIQLSGHAVECSIKAYICALGKAAPKSHDLVKLLDFALTLGLSTSEKDLALLVHLNHQYSRDLRSATRYKARYPSERWELIGGTVPDQAFLARKVNGFCGQASAANEQQRRAHPRQRK